MTQFAIASRTSGAAIGIYEAASADDALDVMARDAGYADFRASCLIVLMGGEDADEIEDIVERARADMDVTEA